MFLLWYYNREGYELVRSNIDEEIVFLIFKTPFLM